MREILISSDPANKEPPKVFIIELGRNCGKEHLIRQIQKNDGYIVVDDIDDDIHQTPEQIKKLRNNYLKWIELYFPAIADQKYCKHQFLIEKQNIRLGVKKRYQKAPRINKYVTIQYNLCISEKPAHRNPLIKLKAFGNTRQDSEKKLSKYQKHSFTPNQQNTL